MARRGTWTSLESLARTQAAKVTAIAIDNVLVQEQFESINVQKGVGEGKRKRSYSCGDDEGAPAVKKKMRREDTQQFMESVQNKRTLSNTETNEPTQKRAKLDETRKKSDTAEPGSSAKSCMENCKDDIGVTYYTASENMFNVLKQYFVRLLPTMWNDYGKSLISEILRKLRLENIDGKYLKKVIEYIFCEKLFGFSTVAIETFSSDLEGIIYERLRHCRRLLSLELTVIPRDDRDLVNATLSFNRLRHLQSLSLLPPTRYSFHWAVREVAQHCIKIRELKIVYSGDHFAAGEGITCLGNRVSLGALWLFNFGRKSESLHLSEVLRSLPNLKVLFHKELPNAILELMCGNGGRVDEVTATEEPVVEGHASSWVVGQVAAGSWKLRLERIDLCWYQRGLGYQLVYVPSSYLLKVAQACPSVRLLNLVGPPCLAQVIASLPCLQAVTLHQASLASCLRCALKEVSLERLTELRVSDVWDVTHDLISAVALACSSLQVLSITSSSLEALGDLLTPPDRPSFPRLREATLVPDNLQGRPSLTSPPVWQLGAALTAYLLKGASLLTSLHLQYKRRDIPEADVPSERDLEAALCDPRPALRQLVLERPPAASPRLVWELLKACPALTTLGKVTTWPITTNQRLALMANYARLLDVT